MKGNGYLKKKNKEDEELYILHYKQYLYEMGSIFRNNYYLKGKKNSCGIILVEMLC